MEHPVAETPLFPIYGVPGIALATTIVNTVHCVMLTVSVHRNRRHSSRSSGGGGGEWEGGGAFGGFIRSLLEKPFENISIITEAGSEESLSEKFTNEQICHVEKVGDPCTVIIVGASGDLTARKIIPALYNLYRNFGMPRSFSIVGCARTEHQGVLSSL